MPQDTAKKHNRPTKNTGADSAPKAGRKGPGMSYLIIGVVAILVIIAVVALALFGMQTPKTSTTAGAPTSPSSNSTQCPCLSEQQLQATLNESNESAALFNTTYVSQLQLQASAANLTNTTELGIIKNLTQGWVTLYENIRNTTNDSVDESVFQSTNPAKVYNYELLLASASGTHLTSGSLNGFTYTYSNTTVLNSTLLVLVGYKANYIVLFFLKSKTSGIYAPQKIASEISSTV